MLQLINEEFLSSRPLPGSQFLPVDGFSGNMPLDSDERMARNGLRPEHMTPAGAAAFWPGRF